MQQPKSFYSIFNKAFLIASIPLWIVYIIGAFSSWMNPYQFRGITFFAIGFPILFFVAIVWCIASIFILKKRSWLFFALLLPGYFNLTNTYSFKKNQPFNTNKGENQVRILTWNVNEFLYSKPDQESWKYEQGEMLSFLKLMNADIMCFQDFIVSPGWAERDIIAFVRDSLGYPNHYFSVDDLDYGTIIFSKFPIKDSGRIVYQQEAHPESIAYTDILINQKPLRIFNTHFRSMYLHHNRLSRNELGNLKYVKEDTNYLFKSTRLERLEYYDRIHTDQAKQVSQAFNQSPIPFVFCADLNAVPSSYVYQILRRNTKDAFIEKGSAIGGTYKKARFLSRIDYILTHKNIETIQYYSPKLNLSDHYPVVADILLNY